MNLPWSRCTDKVKWWKSTQHRLRESQSPTIYSTLQAPGLCAANLHWNRPRCWVKFPSMFERSDVWQLRINMLEVPLDSWPKFQNLQDLVDHSTSMRCKYNGCYSLLPLTTSRLNSSKGLGRLPLTLLIVVFLSPFCILALHCCHSFLYSKSSWQLLLILNMVI